MYLKIGDKFNRLTVESEPIRVKDKAGRPQVYYDCVCECGNRRTIRGNDIKRGDTKSCGCWSPRKTHGMRDTRLFSIWRCMRTRCYNDNSNTYQTHGARGIRVCDDWRDNFQTFAKWALANGYDESLSIDRVDNYGDYTPDNCRWATPVQQARNTRKNVHLTAWGETKLLLDWVQDPRCKATYQMIYYRVRAGWPEENAISTPRQKESNGTSPLVA